MATLKNPVVGSKGLWELKAPFDSLLPTNTALTCTAISNYGQLYAIGIDPWVEYYQPKSIDEETYKSHSDEGRIIFLKTDSGQRYSFPLHYLESYPIGTGVNYVSMGIGVRLGALPVNEKGIDLLVQQFQELANLTVGVDIHAEVMALSDISIVDNASHERLKKAREAKKRQNTPSLQKIADLGNLNTELTKKLKLAETKVIEQDTEIRELKAEIERLKKKP